MPDRNRILRYFRKKRRRNGVEFRIPVKRSSLQMFDLMNASFLLKNNTYPVIFDFMKKRGLQDHSGLEKSHSNVCLFRLNFRVNQMKQETKSYNSPTG